MGSKDDRGAGKSSVARTYLAVLALVIGLIFSHLPLPAAPSSVDHLGAVGCEATADDCCGPDAGAEAPADSGPEPCCPDGCQHCPRPCCSAPLALVAAGAPSLEHGLTAPRLDLPPAVFTSAAREGVFHPPRA